MTTNSPWGVGGSASTGEGTGGPLADRPSDNDEVGCRFNTFPFGVGGGGETPTPTPTYFKLTECTALTELFTTGALTSNIASEVGNVVELAEYAGGWLVETTTNPGSTEALTITASHVDCETYTAGECEGTPPEGLPTGDPPDGYASSYTVTIPDCADCFTPCTVVVEWLTSSWVGVAMNGNGNSTAELSLDTINNRWVVEFNCGVSGGDNDAVYIRECESITGVYEKLSEGHGTFGATASVG